MSTRKENDERDVLKCRVVRLPSVRKAPTVDPPRMELDFNIPALYRTQHSRSSLVRTCVGALVGHVLYARGVVPTPVLDILRAYQQDSLDAAISAPREKRVVVKCGGVIQQLLQQWDEVTESDFADEIGAVLVSLGQWWSRPREQYVMYFHGLSQDSPEDSKIGSGETLAPTDQQEHDLSRRLISLIMNSTNEDQEVADWMAAPSLGASSFQLQISFWVPRTTADQFYQNSRCATKFIARRGFSIQDQPLTGNKSALIKTRVGVDVSSLVREEWDESSGVWMSLPTTVKGFQLAK